MTSPTTKSRRTSISTVAGMISTHQAAQKPLHEPTRQLLPDAMAHFERIITSRTSESWTTADLAQATQLAQFQAQIDAALSVIEREGRTIDSGKGTLTQHPEVKNVAQFSTAARALSTALGMSAAQRGLTGPEQATRNKNEATVRQSMNGRDTRLLAGFENLLFA